MDAVAQVDSNTDIQNNKRNALLEEFWSTELYNSKKLRDSRELAWRASRRAYAVKQNRLYKANQSYDTAPVNDTYIDPSKQPFRVSNAIHYSNVEIMASNIFADSPVIQVGGSTDETSLMAALEQMIQAKMRNLTKKLKLNRMLRSIIYDALLYNIAIVKTGYNLIGTFRSSAPANSPFAIRICPFDYLVDAEAYDDDSARWQGEEYFIDQKEFMQSDNFFNKDRVKDMFRSCLLNPEGRQDVQLQTELAEGISTEVNDATMGTISEADVSMTKRLKVVDVYDKTSRTILTFAYDADSAEGKDVILLALNKFPDYIKTSPFTTCIFNIPSDSYYGFNDYEVIEPKLKEIDKIEQRLLDFTKSLIPKYLFSKTGMKPDEVESLTQAEMLKCIGVDTTSVPLSQMIQPIINAVLPKENFQILMDLRQQINTDLGITEYMKGQTSGKTATEAAIIDSASKTRSSKRQAIFDDFLTDVLQKIYDAMSAMQFDTLWVDEPGKYPIVGRDANGKLTFEVDPETNEVVFKQQKGFKLTKDMLKPFDITVEKGSTSANKSMMQQQLAMNLYQATAGNPQVNQIEVLKFLFTAFNLPVDRFVLKQQAAPQGAPNGNPLAALMGAGTQNAGAVPPEGTEGAMTADMLSGLANQMNPQK